MRYSITLKMSCFFGICFFFSCTSSPDRKPELTSSGTLFEYLPSEITGISFQNTLIPDYDMNAMEYNYFYNGGGVAAADFNNDGLTDLYFTGNQVSSRLYLNRGNFKFEDVTVKAGVQTSHWATGVSVADINNDGLPDLYISCAGYKDPLRRKNLLFINKNINAEGIPLLYKCRRNSSL